MRKLFRAAAMLSVVVLSLVVSAALHAKPAYADPTQANVQCVDGTTQTATRAGATFEQSDYEKACVGHQGYNNPVVDFAAGCTPKGSFLGFPTWYKYLASDNYTDPDTGKTSCHPKLASIFDIWKIVAAVIEMLLRIAALISIGLVVYGGILYTTSQAQPDKTKMALKTIINSLIGLTITIIATVLVNFIAGSFK